MTPWAGVTIHITFMICALHRLASADTLRKGGGGGGGVVDIPGLSMDGHSYSGIRGYSDGVGKGLTSLDYPWMVIVTLASADTLTRGGRVDIP